MSDKIVEKMGIKSRVAVLAISQVMLKDCIKPFGITSVIQSSNLISMCLVSKLVIVSKLSASIPDKHPVTLILYDADESV